MVKNLIIYKMFEVKEGFKLETTPKDDEEVITHFLVSKSKSVYAFSFYLNSAEIFPRIDFEDEQRSWVYIVKAYTGVAIDSASMRIFREGYPGEALDYPAETITNYISPEHVIAAIKIKRFGSLPDDVACHQPHTAKFKILGVFENQKKWMNI